MLDDTNHDLVHTLSVRLDASWHDRSYATETACDGCKRVFERLRDVDEEAVRLLSDELVAHVRANKFPLDLSD
jgi:hypothetical protein